MGRSMPTREVTSLALHILAAIASARSLKARAPPGHSNFAGCSSKRELTNVREGHDELHQTNDPSPTNVTVLMILALITLGSSVNGAAMLKKLGS